MRRILFYTSIQTRVRDQESLMTEFVNQGHRVYFVNQQPNRYLPSICKESGVSYHEYPVPYKNSLIRVILSVCYLFAFIWRKRISVVYSHLEPPNYVAVLTQYIVRAKVIVVRHHHDLAALVGFENDRSYRMTYTLARHVITVSESTKRYMIEREKINPKKIRCIRLGYDFSRFGEVSKETVIRWKSQLGNAIGLITIGRLDQFKRPTLSIEIVRKLSEAGREAHLLILGVGPLSEHLIALSKKYTIENRVSVLGYSDDALSYLKASDWLIHPSVSESSCVVVKEAGVAGIPAIVCKNVGDFDEYLIHQKNSFLVDSDSFVDQAVELILKCTDEKRMELGKALQETVTTRFAISAVRTEYEYFNN